MFDYTEKKESLWCDKCRAYTFVVESEPGWGAGEQVLLKCGHAGLLWNIRAITGYHKVEVKDAKRRIDRKTP